MRCWYILALVCALMPPAFAQERFTALVIVEGLRWQQVERGEIGGLYVLAHYGAVGLMSVGAAGDAQRFALTVQTGKRWAPPIARDAEHLRERFARLRWLTEDAARSGVRVQVNTIPPDRSLSRLLEPSRQPRTAEQVLQVWWLRGDAATLSRALEQAISPLTPERDRLLVVGLPARGESLTPVIAAGGGLSEGVLTSSTTRTEGVVSDVDIAPTLLQWLNTPLRAGEHPMRVVRKDPFSTTQNLARRYRWNAQALIPLGAIQVLGGLLAVLAVVQQTKSVPTRRACLLLSAAVGLLLSLPAGTIIAPYLPAPGMVWYMSNVLIAAAGLSLLAHWGVWEQPFRAYIRACALSVFIILADALSGQYGAKFSIYSAYALSGIRFYGVGNELMGVLVGCALAWGLYGLSFQLRAILWVIVSVVLAAPIWGANLGGLLTSAAGLGCAWESKRAQSRLLWIRCVRWLAVGLLAAIAVMWLDSLSAFPSHVGEAWLRWRHEGWEAIGDLFASKALLMARVLLSPFAWGVLLAIAIALWRMRRGGVFTAFRDSAGNDYLPWLGCIVAAFVFNDSGFVPAAAILGVGAGVRLTQRLRPLCAQEAHRENRRR
ncbi:MAG: hypothetical protein NZ749_00085 [bacterium]|nr:hypothetical protein [bacterium]